MKNFKLNFVTYSLKLPLARAILASSFAAGDSFEIIYKGIPFGILMKKKNEDKFDRS